MRLIFHREPAVPAHPQLSVFGTEGKWRMFRKSRNIFGRTPFSIIMVWQDKSKITMCAKRANGTQVKKRTASNFRLVGVMVGGM